MFYFQRLPLTVHSLKVGNYIFILREIHDLIIPKNKLRTGPSSVTEIEAAKCFFVPAALGLLKRLLMHEK